MMVITVLKAMVESDKEQILKDAYSKVLESAVPAGVVTSFLVRDDEDPKIWRIVTAWKDKEAREKVWREGTPPGIQMFRDSGAEPSLKVLDVVDTMMTM